MGCVGTGQGQTFFFCDNLTEEQCDSQDGLPCSFQIAGPDGPINVDSTNRAYWWGHRVRCFHETPCLNDQGRGRFEATGIHVEGPPFSPGQTCCANFPQPVGFFCPNNVYWKVISTGGVEVSVKDQCLQEASIVPGTDSIPLPIGGFCTDSNAALIAADTYWYTCNTTLRTATACCFPNNCVDNFHPDECWGSFGRSLDATVCGDNACPPPCCLSDTICIEQLQGSKCVSLSGDTGDEFGFCEDFTE